ncbi:MAG TPA: hypothetical protein P5256_06430 [Beijerinckiaceae bacterium]|nr:hypothetical protein [Rhodoblastus sp.]MCC2106147.1 hypothetical protein [Hyphomicrobiales bacterium]MCO5089184.1 hypothetical protein [Methylobacteriaceae bacterium]HPG04750.1 hypothetical protein [Rhodoblastus sp.]HRY02740.1 hypothetical protein [Beijerinckiaceae bacterium]
MRVYSAEGVLAQPDIEIEDGGQALIGQIDESADPAFFVRLQSWDETARGRSLGDLAPEAHATFRRLVGKRLRITIDIID